jgi:4-amino-4-deoxy-L-arabinose transferase-like glycosyltransferase
LLAFAALKTVRRFAWLGLAILLVGASLLWLWAAAVYPKIYVENGPMENFQVGCLGVGALLFAWQARGLQRAERVLFAALALFYITFLIREFDTRKFDWPIANAILSGTIRNVWLGALWLVTGYFIYRSRAKLVPLGLRWVGTPEGRLLLVAGVFWVFGAAVDKLELFGSKPRDMLAEELLEINAALLMMLSAIVSLVGARNGISADGGGAPSLPS